MVLRRFRRNRQRQTKVWAYSRWDGSQAGFDVNAHELFAKLSDDLLYHGNPDAAMRRLMQEGFDVDGNRIQGLREILEKLREQRQERLEQYDLGGVYDDIANELREVVDQERQSLDDLQKQADSSGDERRSDCLLYTSPSPRDLSTSRMPSSA